MVDDVIPPGQKLSTDGKINPTFTREALVRIFKGVKEIHTGRLNVRL
ncbi:MAG: hypothetical protein JSV39_01795 [Candidatus Aenigmatarchaeota archaeon]|nr:MAG: hypothetical protein JSV39_01795 [Candidatus Aenigmarchaeota archaeon]